MQGYKFPEPGKCLALFFLVHWLPEQGKGGLAPVIARPKGATANPANPACLGLQTCATAQMRRVSW